MEFKELHNVDPFYLKAIKLAGEDAQQDLTNDEARKWVYSLSLQSSEHSNVNIFLKYKDFIRELERKVYSKADEFGYEQLSDELIIDTALDLLAAGYGIEQILDDMELFFVAYKVKKAS